MDLVATDDLDPLASEIDDDLLEAEQDLYHRLIEAPGSNADVPDEGSVGVEDALNGVADKELAHRIDHALRKDDRVSAVKTTGATQADGSDLLTVEIELDQNVIKLDLVVTPEAVERLPTAP